MKFDPSSAVPEQQFDPTTAVPEEAPPVRAVLQTAVKQNPDQVARAGALGKQYGLPTDLVVRNLQDVEFQAAVDKADERLKTSPKLATALRKRPEIAPLVHDDIESLAKIESNFAQVAAASVGQAVLGISEGIWRTPDAAQRAVGYLAGQVERTGLPPMLNPIRGVQDVLRFISEGRVPAVGSMGGTTQIADKVNDAQKILTDKETFGSAFADVQTLAKNADVALATAVKTGNLQQAAQVLTDPNYWSAFMSQAIPSLYLAMKSGGSTAFMAWMEGMEQAGNAAEFEKKTGVKISDAEFTQAVTQTALVNALLEKYGLDKVLGAKGGGIKGIFKAIFAEGGTEGLQQVNSNLSALLSYNPEQSLSEGVMASVMGGMGSGGGVSTAQMAAGKLQEIADKRGQQADAANQYSDHLADQLKTAGASALRERSPEQFRALMGEMTDGKIYVDGEVLNQLPEDVKASLPQSVQDQIATAAATGDVVEISTADALTIAPGTALEEVLVEHARTDPFAMSKADAAEATKLAQSSVMNEAQRIIAQAEDADVRRAEYDQIHKLYVDQLNAAARFRPAVNEAKAHWLASFYTTMAARTGMTPAQFQAAHPVRILGEATSAGQTVMGQGEVVDLGDLDALMGVQNNASGESAASLEAQSRVASERANDQQRRVIDVRTGQVTPLVGVDAVDTQAGPGKVIVQKNVGASDWTVLSVGDGVTRNAVMAAVGRGRATGQLNQRKPGEITVEGYHFSKEDRPTITTAAYGTGLQGSGRDTYLNAEDQRLRKRTYFYADKGTGIRPESGVGGRAHRVQLTNVYDSNADPLGLKKGGGGQLGFESRVLDAGFSGYLDRLEGTQPGQVIMLGDQTFRPELLGPQSMIETGQRVPAMPQTEPQWTNYATGDEASLQAQMERLQAKSSWQAYDMRVVDGALQYRKKQVLEQSVTLRKGDETLAAYGLPPGGKYNTRDIAAALEARQREKWGKIEPDDRSPEAADKIAQWMAEEVRFEMLHPRKSGVGWYSYKFQRALDTFGDVFPELKKDKDARSVLTALIAITSDGQKVVPNFRMAIDLYGNWRKGGATEGKFTTSRGHQRMDSIDGNVALFQKMLEDMGPKAARKYLLQEATVSELRKRAKAEGVEFKTDYQAHIKLPMAAVTFGPKLGAFYANLMGAHGYLTMDRWWSRTFNRYRGTLLPKPTDAGVARFKELLGRPEMSDDEALSATVAYQASYEKKGFKNGTEIEKAANTLHKAAFTTIEDAPFNATDRTFMLSAVDKAQKLLEAEGRKISVADIQAVLWYYEKRLYGELGARQTADVSYEDAARVVAKEQAGAASAGRSDAPGAGEAPAGDVAGTEAVVPAEDVGLEPFESGRPLEQSGDLNGQAGNRAGRYSSGSLAPLEGAPNVAGAAGPDPRLVAVAERYAADNGITLRRQAAYAVVDPERAARIAAAYEAMPHAPNDPAVREAYDNLAQQTLAQYLALQQAGYQFYLVDETNDPYAGNPWNAMRDLRANQTMGVFATEAGFGTSEFDPAGNPLLADTGIEWGYGSVDGPKKRVLFNDLFRAVHDAFGHGLEGAGFRAQGEENAWQAHVRLFTGSAVGAITSETRGQNSWLNYGPHGQANQTAKVEDTVFADQKTGLMPEWTWTEGRVEDEQQVLEQRSQEDEAAARAEGWRIIDAQLPSREAADRIIASRQKVTPRGPGMWADYDLRAVEDDVAGFWAVEARKKSLAQEPQQPRGTFNPATLELVLNPNANLSTFFHETGHFFLEVLADIASQPNAPAQIVDDFNTFLKWVGVADAATWNAMTLDQKRGAHERWAESIEQYVMEGKAPSVELQPLMRRFASWLKSVYGSLQKMLTGRPGAEQAPLNDDIRRVMDRLLATDEQIAQANEVAGLVPDEAADAAAAERLAKRSVADLKWSVRARDQVIAKLQKQAKAIEKDIREQVTVEVDQTPEMRAKRALDALTVSPEYAGMLAEHKAARKTAEAAVRDSVRAALLATNPEAKGLIKGQLLAKNKRDIDNKVDAAMIKWDQENPTPKRPVNATDADVATIADSFGFESVDAMMQAIDAFGSRREAIDGLTEKRMLEEHGDLIDERAISEAANEAVHNEARARSLATELRTQREMLGARRDTGETNAKGSKITVNALVEAAKQFAANVVGKTVLRDLTARAWQHTAAERRAAARWQQATAAGKTDEAVKAKQDQMLNHAAAKAAIDAKAEAKKILDFFKRVTKGNDETVVEKGRDPDIVNAARAALAAYGVQGPATKNAADYLETLSRNDPETYNVILPMVEGATRNAQPLDALTFEELQALHEEIQAMWFLAKRSRQSEVDGNLMDREDLADELFARMEDVGIPDTVPGEGKAVTKAEARALFLRQGVSFLRRVEQWAEGMDGKYGGPFLRYVFQPIKLAADKYRADRVAYRKKLQELVDNIAPIVGDQIIQAPELGYTFGTPGSTRGTAMNEILHAIIHTGNESNKRKLLLGRGWAAENPDGTLDTSKWDAFIGRLINEGKLERAHYDFVQGVWDLLEETKPLAQKTHRDVFGRYFSEVTADAFVDPFGVTRRGGYAPAIVDPDLVKDNELQKLANAENESMVYAFPAPAKGFTKSRVEYNRPLLLDLRTLGQHIDKVLLFSHMTAPAADVRRLLTMKKVGQPLTRIDPTVVSTMLQPWLQRSAQQVVETPIAGAGKWARVPSIVRARAGAALMFANVSNAIQQVTGLSAAMVKVKPSHMMRALAQHIAHPVKSAEAVWAASTYMDDRAKNEVAVMNEQMQDILLKPSVYEKAQNWSMRHAYFLQTAIDNALSPIVWTGAYNQAMTDGMGHEEAVRFADGTVRQTQGSTLPEDVSRFETGPAYARAFTQFVGYFNMVANTNGTALQQIANETGLKKGAGRAFSVVMLGLLVPIWAAEVIALAFKGGPDDEDKDGYLDDWLSAVFGFGTVKGMLAMIPILGQAANSAVTRLDNNPMNDRISLSPGLSLIESALGGNVQTVYEILDSDKDVNARRAVRDAATLVSVFTGLPIYAVARPAGYVAGVAQGKIEPQGRFGPEVDFARGLITGAPSPESKQR